MLITRPCFFLYSLCVCCLFCIFVVYFVNSLFLCCCGIVSTFVYSCLFPVTVHVYSPLPLGGNPNTLNKNRHEIYVSRAVVNQSLKIINFILASCKLQPYLRIGMARDLEYDDSGTFQNIPTSRH